MRRSHHTAPRARTQLRRRRRGPLFGVERRLWAAFAVSLVAHAAALGLLAGRSSPPGLPVIEVALYAGDGVGRSGAGAGAGGGSESESPAVASRVAPPADASAAPEARRPSASTGERGPAVRPLPANRASRPAASAEEEHRRQPRQKPGAVSDVAALRGSRKTGDDPGVETPVERSTGADGAGAVAGLGAGGAGRGGTQGGGEGGSGTGSGSGGDLRGHCLSCPIPDYPRQARRHGWQGFVDLRLRLDDGGRVATVAIERSSGFKVLDEAAMAAARRSRFRLREPIRSPATSWGRLRYRFEIGSG